jgi:hypothetical protein
MTAYGTGYLSLHHVCGYLNVLEGAETEAIIGILVINKRFHLLFVGISVKNATELFLVIHPKINLSNSSHHEMLSKQFDPFFKGHTFSPISLFSNTLSLCPSLKLTDQLSSPHKQYYGWSRFKLHVLGYRRARQKFPSSMAAEFSRN